MTHSEDNLDTNQPQPESVIKSIMVEQEEKSRGALDPFSVALNAVNTLGDRERDVLASRYGLGGDRKATLEEVGQKFQITRERVRQIESTSLQKLSAHPTKELTQLIKIINSRLAERGGLVTAADLLKYLKADEAEQVESKTNALRLVMDANSAVRALSKDAHLRTGWVKQDFPVELLNPIIDAVADILTAAGHTLTEKEIWEALLHTEIYQKYESQLSRNGLSGILAVAALVAQTPDGKWGLVSWPTVVPKRIRDKVFLVMETKGKPMHFNEITDAINRRYGGKLVLSRTVHNELISDKRFVLVGRGTYALKSWGFRPGVVADVIVEVLKTAGRPLTVDEIVEAVLAKRQVKSNTVIANLQNKQLFQKVGRGLYQLAE